MTHASKHANNRTNIQTSSHTGSHATTRTTPRRAAARAPLWLGALLATLAGSAAAHDTWFATQPPGPRAELVLALGTGERFPRQETALDMALVQASACQALGGHDGAGTAALQWQAYRADAVLLRTAGPAPAGARLSCWMEAKPLSISLDDSLAQRYLDEIQALPAVRARWAALRARGVRWQERYVKNARIELPAAAPGQASAGQASAAAAPGLDLQADMPAGPLRAGATLRVQLLRDGQPLAGLPVVLRNDLSPLALWHRSDADGWVTAVLPLAARWLLSAVDLRPSGTQPDGWDSRFVSLAIETLPRR